MTTIVYRADAYFETVKKMIQLIGCEVPRKFRQQVMKILDNSLMFPMLGLPYRIQIVKRERVLFDHKPEHFLQSVHILWLVEGIT